MKERKVEGWGWAEGREERKGRDREEGSKGRDREEGGNDS